MQQQNPGGAQPIWRPMQISNPSTKLRQARSMPHWVTRESPSSSVAPPPPPAPIGTPPVTTDPDYEVIEFAGGSQQYSNTEPVFEKVRKSKTPGRCDLCGSSIPTVQCDQCPSQHFCASCDDMYHRHPKRQHHARKSLGPIAPPLRPPLPPKGEAMSAPVAPPRKNKHSSARSSSSRFTPSPLSAQFQLSSSTHTLHKKEPSGLIGSLKRFMGGRPLPPPPHMLSRDSRMSQPALQLKHNMDSKGPSSVDSGYLDWDSDRRTRSGSFSAINTMGPGFGAMGQAQSMAQLNCPSCLHHPTPTMGWNDWNSTLNLQHPGGPHQAPGGWNTLGPQRHMNTWHGSQILAPAPYTPREEFSRRNSLRHSARRSRRDSSSERSEYRHRDDARSRHPDSSSDEGSFKRGPSKHSKHGGGRVSPAMSYRSRHPLSDIDSEGDTMSRKGGRRRGGRRKQSPIPSSPAMSRKSTRPSPPMSRRGSRAQSPGAQSRLGRHRSKQTVSPTFSRKQLSSDSGSELSSEPESKQRSATKTIERQSSRESGGGKKLMRSWSKTSKTKEPPPNESLSRVTSPTPSVPRKGGWECEHCTLVNPVGTTVCSVCCKTSNASLASKSSVASEEDNLEEGVKKLTVNEEEGKSTEPNGNQQNNGLKKGRAQSVDYLGRTEVISTGTSPPPQSISTQTYDYGGGGGVGGVGMKRATSLADDVWRPIMSRPMSRQSTLDSHSMACSPIPTPDIVAQDRADYEFHKFSRSLSQTSQRITQDLPHQIIRPNVRRAGSQPPEYISTLVQNQVKQGMEMVKLLREAEQNGFTAEDLTIALSHCGESNPVTWLINNWRHMIDTVVTLATNYGHERSENNVGTLSAVEARDALRLHNGNVWAAVTECVETRQKKFNDLMSRGNFTREDIVTVLTANHGNVESAFVELNKTQLKPFLMRIWGPPQGLDNDSGDVSRFHREEDNIATNANANGEVGSNEVSYIHDPIGPYSDNNIVHQRSKSMSELNQKSFYDNNNEENNTLISNIQLRKDNKPLKSTISTIYSSNVDLRINTEPMNYYQETPRQPEDTINYHQQTPDTRQAGVNDNIEYIDEDDDETLTIRNTLHNEYVAAIVSNETLFTNETVNQPQISTNVQDSVQQANVIKTAFVPYAKMKFSGQEGNETAKVAFNNVIQNTISVPEETQNISNNLSIPIQTDLERESEKSTDLKYTNSFSGKNVKKPNVAKRKSITRSIRSVKKKVKSKLLGQKENEPDKEVTDTVQNVSSQKVEQVTQVKPKTVNNNASKVESAKLSQNEILETEHTKSISSSQTIEKEPKFEPVIIEPIRSTTHNDAVNQEPTKSGIQTKPTTTTTTTIKNEAIKQEPTKNTIKKEPMKSELTKSTTQNEPVKSKPTEINQKVETTITTTIEKTEEKKYTSPTNTEQGAKPKDFIVPKDSTSFLNDKVQNVKTNVINTIQSLTNVLNTMPLSTNKESNANSVQLVSNATETPVQPKELTTITNETQKIHSVKEHLQTQNSNPVFQTKNNINKVKNNRRNNKRNRKIKPNINKTKDNITATNTNGDQDATKQDQSTSINAKTISNSVKITDIHLNNKKPKEKVTVEFEKDIIFVSDGDTHKLIIKPQIEKILESQSNNTNEKKEEMLLNVETIEQTNTELTDNAQQKPTTDPKLTEPMEIKQQVANKPESEIGTNKNDTVKKETPKIHDAIVAHTAVIKEDFTNKTDDKSKSVRISEQETINKCMVKVEDSDEWEDDDDEDAEQEEEEEIEEIEEEEEEQKKEQTMTLKDSHGKIPKPIPEPEPQVMEPPIPQSALQTNMENDIDLIDSDDDSQETEQNTEQDSKVLDETNTGEEYTDESEDEEEVSETESSNIITKHYVKPISQTNATESSDDQYIDAKDRSSSSSGKVESSTDENSDFLSVQSEFNQLETFLNEMSVPQPKTSNNLNKTTRTANQVETVAPENEVNTKKVDDKKKAVQILTTKIAQIQFQENKMMSPSPTDDSESVLNVKINAPDQLFEQNKIGIKIESPSTSSLSDKEMVLNTKRAGTSSSADISSEILDSSSRCDPRDNPQAKLPHISTGHQSQNRTMDETKLNMTENKQEILELLRQSLSNETVLEDIINKLFRSVMGETDVQNTSGTIDNITHPEDNSSYSSETAATSSALKTNIITTNETILQKSPEVNSTIHVDVNDTSKVLINSMNQNKRYAVYDLPLQPTIAPVDNVAPTPQSVSPVNVALSDFEREVRRCLAEGLVSNYEQAELAVKLMRMSFDQELSVAAAKDCSTEQAALAYLQQECTLCAGKYPMGQMVSMLECEHHCCNDCATAYFTLTINERSINDCVCPFCNSPDLKAFDDDRALDYFSNLDILLKTIVDEQAHELFQRKLRDRTLMQDPNFKWCTKCSSGFIADPRQKKFICPDCNSVSCAKCNRPWAREHERKTCDEFSAWLELSDPNSSISRHLIENDGIVCPKCHSKYALAKGGCMHLTCPSCKYEFCSDCGREFLMGTKCTVSSYCEKLGLHSHHPRNCLFYLRDKEPGELQQLLRDAGVEFKEGVSPDQKKCNVQLQREINGDLQDGFCNLPVEGSTLCRTHYIEYLAKLIHEYKLDPVVIFELNELLQEFRRRGKTLPDRPKDATEHLYRKICIKIIQEEIPLD